MGVYINFNLTTIEYTAIILLHKKQKKDNRKMDFVIDQKSYDEYFAKKDSISNKRIRPDDQNFFDALMSIDMKNDPDGKRIIENIKAL